MFINVYEDIQNLIAMEWYWQLGVGTSTHYFDDVLRVEQRNQQVPRLQCRSQSTADVFQA